MDVVLGVSMTPTAVRLSLVEGERADGPTVDENAFHVAAGVSPAASDAPEQVVAAILGTRESAAEGCHRLIATGVAWTDHAAAARVRQALRAQRVDNVVLVSQLHAAGALAQALGQAAGHVRTALLLLEPGLATLAVVRTADGAVVRATTRSLLSAEAAAGLVSGLGTGAEPPQAIFVAGAGVDVAALAPVIAARTSLPVHVPADGALALARGAALAAVNTPRYDASTAWLLPSDDTAAGPTQRAAASYLGYSAVDDDDDADDYDYDADDADDHDADDVPSHAFPDEDVDRRPFALLSGALSTILVLGVVALVIAMAVAMRPVSGTSPTPGDSALVTSGQSPTREVPPATAPDPPETIQAPVPVAREAPRTVFVAPPPAVAVPVPQAPAPALEPPPAPEAPPAPAPAPAPAPVAPPRAGAPAPAPAQPAIVVPVPILPPRLPAIFQIPGRAIPANPATATTDTTTAPPSRPSAPAPATPTTSEATSQATPTEQAAAADSPTATPTTSTTAASADGDSAGSAASPAASPTTVLAPGPSGN